MREGAQGFSLTTGMLCATVYPEAGPALGWTRGATQKSTRQSPELGQGGRYTTDSESGRTGVRGHGQGEEAGRLGQVRVRQPEGEGGGIPTPSVRSSWEIQPLALGAIISGAGLGHAAAGMTRERVPCALGPEPAPRVSCLQAAPSSSSSCLGPGPCLSRTLHAAAPLPTVHLQHLQPPQRPEGPFLDAADVVLVQLSVKQRKIVERKAHYQEQNVQMLLSSTPFI